MKCHWSTKAMTLLLSEKRICSSTQDGHERARNMINHKILVYLIFRSSYSTCNLTPPRREVPQAVVAVERPHFFVHSMFLVGPVLFFFHGMETSLNKSMFGCICETYSSKPKTNVQKSSRRRANYDHHSSCIFICNLPSGYFTTQPWKIHYKSRF